MRLIPTIQRDIKETKRELYRLEAKLERLNKEYYEACQEAVNVI